MKLRSIIVLICLIALALAAAAVWYLHGRRYDVVITQQQIDQALQAKFQMSKTYLAIFEIEYSNPHVILLPATDRIEVGLDAELNMRLGSQTKKLGGTVTATTGLSYRSETNQFFLSDPKIENMSIQGVPQKYMDKVTSLSSNTVREYLQKYPVYTLRGKDTKTATLKLLLKDVQVRSNEVHAIMGF
jgi:hypothetical protein